MKIEKKMIVLTAPSGAGKTTIAKQLLQIFPFLTFSISATTRPPRSYENDGVDYYFYSRDIFDQKVAHGEFAEFEEVYPGKFYGTLKSEVQRIWDRGLMVLFDVDVKGAKTLKNRYGSQCLSLFIRPVSMEVLKERLQERRTEDPASLQIRLDRAEYELGYEDEFDISITNDELATAIAESKEHILEFIGATDLAD